MPAPINPVDFMQDVVINEGTRKVPTSNAGKEKVFKEMLAEQVFLKNMFDNEDSVFKPEPEEGEGGLNRAAISGVYGDYMRRQMATYVVEQGFLNKEVQGVTSSGRH